MSGSAAATAAAKVALQEARKFLARPMHTDEWRLAGRIEVVAELEPGRRWLVKTPQADPLRLEHIPSGYKLVVPFREMETDFASIPELARRLAGKAKALHLEPMDYAKSAFFHDQIFAAAWCWCVRAGLAIRVTVTKRQADAILFVCLECEGATWADGLAYHGGVSLFGQKAWRAARKRNESWWPVFEDEEMREEDGAT